MPEQRELLPIDPETVIYEWQEGSGDYIFALGRGEFEGRVFHFGFSHSRDLSECRSKATDLEPSRGTIVIGVGVDKEESFEQEKVVFDNQVLGLWFDAPYKPEEFRGFRRIKHAELLIRRIRLEQSSRRQHGKKH